MAPLSDPVRLSAYRSALENWRFKGFIRWSEQALRGLRRETDSCTAMDLGRLMRDYVHNGGEIDEVVETRPEWSEHAFHYDLHINTDSKPMYIETRLFSLTRTTPTTRGFMW